MKNLYRILLLLPLGLWAQTPLLTEDFNYTAGDALTDHNWAAHSGGTTNPVLVTAPGLSFTGYYGSGIGNAAGVNNTGQDVNRTFATQENTSVYTSFLVNVTASTVDEFFIFVCANPISTAFRGRVFAQPDGTGTFKLGLSFNAAAAQATSTATFNYGTTYLVVLKYVSIAGATNDTVSLYAFAAGDSFENEPATALIGPLTGTAADLNPGTVGLRQFSATQLITVDGIRVDDEWNLLADAPASSTVVAANAALCAGANTTLSLSATYTDVAYKWQSSADGTTFTDIAGATSATYTTSQTASTYYRAVITNISGLSYTTASVQIVTYAVTPAPTVADANQAFCTPTTVGGLVTGGAVIWYAAETGGTALATTDVLPAAGTYYAAQVVNGCESAARTAVVFSVSNIAPPAGEATQTFNVAEGQNVTLDDIVITATGTVTWYASQENAENDVEPLNPDTYSIPIGQTVTLYAVQTVGECTSAPFAVAVTTVLATTGFAQGTFTYYPNPVKDRLTLTYTQTIDSVAVYNLLGQEVLYITQGQNEAVANLSILAKGTYMVKVASAGALTTIKIIKE